MQSGHESDVAADLPAKNSGGLFAGASPSGSLPLLDLNIAATVATAGQPALPPALSEYMMPTGTRPSADRAVEASRTEPSEDKGADQAVPIIITVLRQETHLPTKAPMLRSDQHFVGQPSADASVHHPREAARTEEKDSNRNIPVPSSSIAAKSAGDVAIITLVGGPSESVAQQIFQTIAGSDSAPAAAGPFAAVQHELPQQGPMRLLTLQLSPGELGKLTIVLSRTDSALRIQVDAERDETADTVAAGRRELIAKLTDAGYGEAEVVVIRHLAEGGSPVPEKHPQTQSGPTPDGQSSSHLGEQAGRRRAPTSHSRDVRQIPESSTPSSPTAASSVRDRSRRV